MSSKPTVHPDNPSCQSFSDTWTKKDQMFGSISQDDCVNHQKMMFDGMCGTDTAWRYVESCESKTMFQQCGGGTVHSPYTGLQCCANMFYCNKDDPMMFTCQMCDGQSKCCTTAADCPVDYPICDTGACRQQCQGDHLTWTAGFGPCAGYSHFNHDSTCSSDDHDHHPAQHTARRVRKSAPFGQAVRIVQLALKSSSPHPYEVVHQHQGKRQHQNRRAGHHHIHQVAQHHATTRNVIGRCVKIAKSVLKAPLEHERLQHHVARDNGKDNGDEDVDVDLQHGATCG